MKSVSWENGRTIQHLLPKTKIKGTVVKYQAKVGISSLKVIVNKTNLTFLSFLYNISIEVS